MLLQDGADNAKQLIDEYEPDFASKEEYFAFADNINLDYDAVSYEEEYKAILTF